jgi:hypothetical protein
MAALLAAKLNAATVAVAMNLRIVIAGVSGGRVVAGLYTAGPEPRGVITKRWMCWSAGRWVSAAADSGLLLTFERVGATGSS